MTTPVNSSLLRAQARAALSNDPRDKEIARLRTIIHHAAEALRVPHRIVEGVGFTMTGTDEAREQGVHCALGTLAYDAYSR